MKCCYASCMLKPWALILALILSFAVTTDRLPEEISRLSQAHEPIGLSAVLNVACANAESADLKWRRLFKLYSTDGVVPHMEAPTAVHVYF